MRHITAALALLALAACGPSQQSGAPSQPAPSAAEMQAAIAALPAPYNQANYEDGRRVFAQCRSCHTIAAGGRNLVGPSLHGVVGRRAGSLQGFTYSQPMQHADFTWDPEHLDQWLANPQTYMPGTRMSFAGVRDDTQRRDVIAYVMVESAKRGSGE
jgi:cytochrome c